MLRVLLLLMLSFIHHTVSAEEVNFQTSDNATIYANYQSRGSHAVLLAHGAIFNKESWGEFEQRLLAENFTVLAIDFRGYNKSTTGNKPQALYEDIIAGIRFLTEQRGIKQVSVLGTSMGGAAAAKASVLIEGNAINRLILLSPARVYQPENLKGSLLFIASKDEHLAKKVTSSFNKAPEPKALLLIKGRAHAQHIFNTAEGETLTSSIIKFLHGY